MGWHGTLGLVVLRLLPGRRLEHVRPQLVEASTKLANVRTTTYPGDRFNAYLKWTGDQLGVLRYSLSRDSLDRLITTEHYRTLCLLDPATKGNELHSVVDIEIIRQIDEFDAAIAELDGAASRHAGADRILVPDTNVFLQRLPSYERLAWSGLAPAPDAHVQLLVPLLVIDELDKAKLRTHRVHWSTRETVRARARRTLRMLEEGFASGYQYELGGAAPGRLSVTFLPEDSTHVRLPRPDDELVDIAQGVAALTSSPVTVVSDDTGLRLRARLAGLGAVASPGEDPEEPESSGGA